jgi:hypothetical protein
LIIVCVTSAALAAPALAVSQNGYRDVTGYDGVRASIGDEGISPRSDDCLIFSVSAESTDAEYQLEVGFLKCGSNATIDHTCGVSGHKETKFVEQDFQNSYTCYPHGDYSGGTYSYRATRDATGSNIIYGYIGSTEYEGEGGLPRATTMIQAWGEESNANTCSGWTAFGAFSSLSRYNISTGFSVINPSTYSYGPACWTRTGISGGNFDVYR